ncbi:MAG: methionyl-tRNA formyltransferase [Arenicellales bacterium]
MRIVFAGTPEFAVPALKALVAARHDVEAVVTQPDRPAGRGRRTISGPVKDCALALGLDVRQPAGLKDPSLLADIRVLQPQVIVVVAYGLLLPRALLELPDHGCINVHASLLPRWRGAAPIQRAVEAGDPETGVTIMRMEAGLDTGPMLARRVIPITSRDTGGTLHDRLAALGAELLVETLGRLDTGSVQAVPQDDRLATYAPKITTEDARLDWHRSAARIERQVRAMNPWPVVRTHHRDHQVRVWEAVVVSGSGGVPGEIIRLGRDGVDVACGDGVLRLTGLQREGGKPLSAFEFLNGYRLEVGEKFDSPH